MQDEVEGRCGGVRYLKSWEGEKELREEGRIAGREEGREEGDLRRLISLVCKKLTKGKDTHTIAEELEEDDVPLVLEIIKVAESFAPEYDPKTVYEAYTSRG
jgi:predicted transposase YdaD